MYCWPKHNRHLLAQAPLRILQKVYYKKMKKINLFQKKPQKNRKITLLFNLNGFFGFFGAFFKARRGREEPHLFILFGQGVNSIKNNNV